ncbi:extracellular solute-binding protein [Tepidicaulis sp.]|uniref:extracellular solute-binding protein n=1 Tax=Tepidicaulis sp. TaxID=1920809 RepID=UPI003B5A40A3
MSRTFFRTAAALGLSLSLSAGVSGAYAGEAQHGLSIFGDFEYEKGFSHFSYANPEAPKGGTLSLIGPTVLYNQGFMSFDSLNSFILRGTAAQGMEMTFDTLMVRNFNEPDALYGLVAESAALSEDGNRLTFHLRGGAYFHDGSPLTAEDAAFTLELLKEKGHPLIAQNMREIASVSAPDAATLVIEFTGKQTRDLPLFLAQLPVFSKAYYTEHEFDRTTLEPPLGSGPYKVKKAEPGRAITYERVKDYWARDLNVNKGRWNFGEIRFEYFRDRTAQFEAFKAGQYLFREEFTSKVWATEYNFPALKEGRVKQLVLPDESPSGAQGWFINTRREKFADPRLREALSYAFDFEWTNRNQFYGLYKRTESFFENSPMKAEGMPSEGELALLEPYRNRLPEEVFGKPVRPPVSDGSGRDRKLLRKAAELLEEAGWRIEDGKRVNAEGQVLSIEFLTNEPTWERINAPYIRNLQFLGIDAKLRVVDSAQYQRRLDTYDFDLTTMRYSMALTPGIEMRSYWGSSFAAQPGSRNLSGISDPVIDMLIDKVIEAASREEQETAARALDRVLRAGHYWVPQWYKASHHLAFWDRFGRPASKPAYRLGAIDTWWSTGIKDE